MSLAYFIVLNADDADFDTFVDGKSIAHAFDEIMEFCKSHGLKTIEDFHSQDVSEMLGEFDDIELPVQEIRWFSADEGIEWVNALIMKLEHENPSFLNAGILEDFKDYLDVFNKTKKSGAKWHLELDF